MWSRLTAVAVVSGFVVALPLRAQAPSSTGGARLELTSSSEDAKAAFRLALFHALNQSPVHATTNLDKALALDPEFGLALAYRSTPAFSPGVDAAERGRRLSDAIGRMTKASAAEMLLAVSLREIAAGRTEVAKQLLRAVSDMVPGDPDVAYLLASQQIAGRPPAEAQQGLRTFLARFPDHAAAQNQMAYSSWAAGDRAAAFAAGERYLQVAPMLANPHDTYADLLLLDRRPDEAVPHVTKAMEADPTYAGGHQKLGAIDLMKGNSASALSHFGAGRDAARTPAAKLENQHWIAVAHVLDRNLKAAMAALGEAATLAESEKLPAGPRALPHQRMAVVEALLGNRAAVQAHLDKSAEIGGASTGGQTAHATIAFASIGDIAAARNAAAEFAKVVAPGNPAVRTFNALIALLAKDVAAASAELANANPNDLLAKELRAEVLKSQGKTAEAKQLRAEILSSSVKQDGNNAVNFFNVVARLRADKL